MNNATSVSAGWPSLDGCNRSSATRLALAPPRFLTLLLLLL
jgi:hypothetical protein